MKFKEFLIEGREIYYHGSNTKIDKFSLDKLGTNTNSVGIHLFLLYNRLK